MSDPIKEALASVETGAETTDPGAGDRAHGEQPDARPEGPAPDAGDRDDAAEEIEEESGGFSVLSWAKDVPEGSHTDFDASDWWDVEGGGENRLAFHLSTIADSGGGYPNGVGVLVALAELYWRRVTDGESGGESGGESSAPDAETVDRETAEAMT